MIDIKVNCDLRNIYIDLRSYENTCLGENVRTHHVYPYENIFFEPAYSPEMEVLAGEEREKVK